MDQTRHPYPYDSHTSTSFLTHTHASTGVRNAMRPNERALPFLGVLRVGENVVLPSLFDMRS